MIMGAGCCDVLDIEFVNATVDGSTYSNGFLVPVLKGEDAGFHSISSKVYVKFTCGTGEEPTPFCRLCHKYEFFHWRKPPGENEFSWYNLTAAEFGAGYYDLSGLNDDEYHEGECGSENSFLRTFSITELFPGTYKLRVYYGKSICEENGFGAPNMCIYGTFSDNWHEITFTVP
jgi:hypothetical protein